jgi:hypothetical protein
MIAMATRSSISVNPDRFLAPQQRLREFDHIVNLRAVEVQEPLKTNVGISGTANEDF